jgi:hypothetical protein
LDVTGAENISWVCRCLQANAGWTLELVSNQALSQELIEQVIQEKAPWRNLTGYIQYYFACKINIIIAFTWNPCCIFKEQK